MGSPIKYSYIFKTKLFISLFLKWTNGYNHFVISFLISRSYLYTFLR